MIMKKLLLSAFTLLLCLSGVCQTYYYECVSEENPETGMRERYNGSFYLTFTGGGYNFYQADRTGAQMGGYSRREELGKDSIYQRVETYVMYYNMFGPVMGTRTIYLGCDGVFSRNGWKNDMMRFTASRYEYYYTLNGNVKSDKGYLEVLVSSDYSTVQFINLNTFSHKGWLITAKRKNSPDNPGSPTQMW